MKRTIALYILLLIFPLTVHASGKAGYLWNQLQEGLEYARFPHSYDTPEAHRLTTIHAFRVDPHKMRLDVITATSDRPRGESIKSMAQRTHALVAVNGGFFTPEHKSIGLVITSGKQVNPLHRTSWWSIFAVKNGQASIIPPWQVGNRFDYDMALQAGPRLVTDGRIPKLKEDEPNARTAVGIARDGKVIIVATDGDGLTMKELAFVMMQNNFIGGLWCIDAMALDGGSSTQLYARAGNLTLSVNGLTTIPNALAVFPR